MRGIYVHIPFCLQKCPYCDFYSVRFDEGAVDAYADALVRNFKAYSGVKADTVYFGGGTPSCLAVSTLGRIVNGLKESFDIAGNAEITIEANPCTVTPQKLRAYRDMGFDRISFGVQSADDNELRGLGRLHDADTAKRAVNAAHDAGFENISADLMIGVAGQTKDSLQRSIDTLTALPVSHISAYMLKIEPGTPFDNEHTRAAVADDELMRGMYLSLVKSLAERGFAQYEISNFAKAGFESRHNLVYWTGGEYIGFGPAAHSLYKGRRFYVPGDLEKYISSPTQPELDEDEPYSEREEYIMLALRLTSGLDTGKLISLYGLQGADRVTALARRYEKAGLCHVTPERISLTPEGFLVSNSIIVELMEKAL